MRYIRGWYKTRLGAQKRRDFEDKFNKTDHVFVVVRFKDGKTSFGPPDAEVLLRGEYLWRVARVKLSQGATKIGPRQ